MRGPVCCLTPSSQAVRCLHTCRASRRQRCHSTGTVHAFYGKQLNLGISLTAFPPVAIQAHWAEARFYYSRRHECASLLSTMEVHGVRNLTTTDAGVRWFFHAFPNFLSFSLLYTNLFLRPRRTHCIVAACCYRRRTFRGLCVGHTREPWSWSRVGQRYRGLGSFVVPTA